MVILWDGKRNHKVILYSHLSLKKERGYMICGIYCIENKINNKKYIGQSIDIEKRWYNHINALELKYHYNIHLQRAWDKYGSSNFDFYILELCDKRYLDEKEIYYITKYDTFKNGYNRTSGGKGVPDIIVSEEVRKKIAVASTGRFYSEKTREKMRQHMLKQFQDSEFVKAFRKNIESQMMPVCCYNQSGYICSYTNIHEAAKAIGAEPTNVCKVLKGKHKTCNGYTFCYEYEVLSADDLKYRYNLAKSNNPHDSHKKAKVEMFDLFGNFIEIFDSIKEASAKYNLDESSISKVCRNKLKQTHGFIFKYAN